MPRSPHPVYFHKGSEIDPSEQFGSSIFSIVLGGLRVTRGLLVVQPYGAMVFHIFFSR